MAPTRRLLLSNPCAGARRIAAYWSRATGLHTNVHFGYELLALDSNQSIAHWWCSFVRPPAKVSLKLDAFSSSSSIARDSVRHFASGGIGRRVRPGERPFLLAS